MSDYGTLLRAKGLTDLQTLTILSAWSCDSIEAMLRGEIEPPSHDEIAESVVAWGAD